MSVRGHVHAVSKVGHVISSSNPFCLTHLRQGFSLTRSTLFPLGWLDNFSWSTCSLRFSCWDYRLTQPCVAFSVSIRDSYSGPRSCLWECSYHWATPLFPFPQICLLIIVWPKTSHLVFLTLRFPYLQSINHNRTWRIVKELSKIMCMIFLGMSC